HRHHKGTQAYTPGRAKVAEHKKTVAHIQGGPVIFAAQVKRICRKGISTISVAVCPSQNIVGADCGRTPEAILHVDNQLVLVEATGRLKLKKIFIAKGAHTTICHAR